MARRPSHTARRELARIRDTLGADDRNTTAEPKRLTEVGPIYAVAIEGGHRQLKVSVLAYRGKAEIRLDDHRLTADQARNLAHALLDAVELAQRIDRP